MGSEMCIRDRHPAAQAPLLHDYLMPHSSLAVQGTPADWQGQSLDLDFFSLSGQPLHLRGGVLLGQAMAQRASQMNDPAFGVQAHL